MSTSPLISIIIVNYNGKSFLKNCLDSVLNQSLAKNKYEIIVVDNDSTDNSVTFIKRYYPQVKLIESNENLGFAGGNNLGVQHALGKYIVLLNNDTRVDKHWLRQLLERIESDPSIAAVNSKSLLYYPFLQIEIESDVFLRSEFTDTLDFQSVGVAIEEVVTNNPALQRMIQYYQGFYKKENDQKNQIPIRWTNGKGMLLVGIDPDKAKARYVLTVRAQKNTSKLKTNLRIKVGNTVLVEDSLKAQQVKQFTLDLTTSELTKYLLYEVQNAGNVIFKSGHSRDRGAVVGNKQQYYEVDSDYFEKPTTVHAFCGVSVMLRKDIFTKLGGFDESFFMYYEDVDLSLRLRRLGYKLYYEPTSIMFMLGVVASGHLCLFIM
jgi:GT2 family glycosyltransferase